MLGFLVYLPTLFNVPHYLFALAFLYASTFRVIDRAIFRSNAFKFITLIIVLSIFNNIFSLSVVKTIRDVFPFYVLLLATYVLAFSLNRRDVEIILALVFIESVAILVQKTLGVQSFFPGFVERQTEAVDLLYYSSPTGFSSGGPSVSIKLFLGLLLVPWSALGREQKLFFYVFLSAAALVVFNRTVVILVLFLTFVHCFSVLGASKKSFLLIGLLVGLFIVLPFYFYDFFFVQLTRGGHVDLPMILSNRHLIWGNYYDFIVENPLLGNGSFKLMLYFSPESSFQHAHNSYLQLIGTNGLIISVSYFVLILMYANKKNILPVFFILAYSFFQYGIFWGVSLLDIFFMYFLFRRGTPN